MFHRVAEDILLGTDWLATSMHYVTGTLSTLCRHDVHDGGTMVMVEMQEWKRQGKLRIVRVAEELADTMIAARQSPFIIILSVSLIHTPFRPKQQQFSQPSFCHFMESNTKQHLDKMFLSHQCLKNGQRPM